MAIPFDQHLQPRNASNLDIVLAAAGARLNTLPVQIDLLKRPYEVPSQFLAHLGFELSVDIWERTWRETRKRAVVANALLLQMKKGTAYCLREYARYADAEVTRIERPPMRVFSGKSLTKADREAWLATLPQVRVWHVRDSVPAAPRKAFYGGRAPSARLHSARFYLNWPALIPSTALERLGRRARWIVDGVETDTRVTNVGSIFRLHLPAPAALRVFANRVAGRRYYEPSTARTRLLSIRPKAALPWRSAVTPGLQAVDSEPETIRNPGTRGFATYCDLPAGLKAFFVPSSAPMRVYERYAVLDGRSAARRAAVQFMGVGRYGFPTHTAWAHVSVYSKRNRHQAGEGITARRRFWMPHNPLPLEKVRSALAASKRLSDRIKMVTGPVPPFIAGGRPVLAGIDSVIVSRQ
ncbi:phage tail protein I [Bradyrhizobium valentinum]|uniref:Phage tail protein n=1 Tax=Bradyrhizobium valentinum TaxID=1518501 RepID=A0A0R3L2L2_9BRAD|nr:phage tail protein I [Bradyrhizobium valentinum]KRQ99279.1 hypothetical protein CP49_11830 [Bradyrhizobium valentinum]